MKQIIRIILYIASAILISGCSKDEVQSLQKTNIQIEVEAPLTNGWHTESNIGTRSCEINTVRQESKNGLGIQINTQPDFEATTMVQTTTRWTNLNSKTTFRVVAYKSATAEGISTSNYVDYGDYKLSDSTVETARSLTLPIGTYTFICYSYGNSTDISAFTNTLTSVSATNGQNFMTCVKEGISINNIGSKYTLSDIVFKHHCARYVISVEAQRGKISNVTACSGTLTLPNKDATYSFTTNAFTTDDSTCDLNVSWKNPNNMTVCSKYVYVLPIESKTVKIKLNSTVGGRAFSNKSFSLTKQSFNNGASYCSHISFTLKEGYLVGGAIWAPGNLYYDGSFKNQQTMYAFSTNASSGYWQWDTLYPNSSTSPSTTSWTDNDPCRKIAPTGTWKLPSKNTYDTLIKETVVYSTLGGRNGVLFGNTLFIPAASYYARGNDVPLGTDLRGIYWTQNRDDVSKGGGYCLDISMNNYTNVVVSSLANPYCFTIRCIKAE